MKKENFLLLSLDDKKAKNVANIVNNDSSRKILNFLTQKEDATETQIVKELKLPASTVHYNLEQLKKVGLVDWEKYHYSEKGKEVKHYHLVNKYIIIAPKNDPSFLEKLKNIIPAFAVTLVGTFGIYFFNSIQKTAPVIETSGAFMAKSRVFDEAMPLAMEADMGIMEEALIVEPTFLEVLVQEPAFWFFLGAVVALGVVLIWNSLKRK